jgi:hypothetical protein
VALSDDQKALLRLLAQREQGYEDIAAVMGLSVDEVRTRVRQALAGLEDEGEAPAPPAPRAGEIPRDRRRLFELIGGAIVAILLVLFATGLVDIGGNGDGEPSGETATPPVAATGGESAKLTQAVLRPVDSDDNAVGRALFGRIGRKVALQVVSTGLEQPPKGEAYVVWFARSEETMVPLTPASVDRRGRIAAQYPVPAEILDYLARGVFDEVAISLVSVQTYKSVLAEAMEEGEPPVYTGVDVLRGTITGPIVGVALEGNR